MLYTAIQFKEPLSKREIHVGVRNRMRTEFPQLVRRFTSKEVDKVVFFLRGYYHLMSRDLIPPFSEVEIKEHLIDLGFSMIISELQR